MYYARASLNMLALFGVMFVAASERTAFGLGARGGLTASDSVTNGRIEGPAVRDRDPTVVVDIQLSPCIAAGPVTRCIHFTVYQGCSSSTEIDKEVTFTNGMALDVAVTDEPGTYMCIEARDPLHTLRSTSALTFDGTKYTGSFVGDPLWGGNWLIGGDLDANYHIDAIDYGIFLVQFGTVYPDGDTTCETGPQHADINADRVVDDLDVDFILENFGSHSKVGCCDKAGAARAPVVDVSVEELRSVGMGELVVADLNADGRLNVDDMRAFMQQDAPAATATRMTEPSGPRDVSHIAPSFRQDRDICQPDPLAHDGPVDLVWIPPSQQVPVGETVRVNLYAVSNDQQDHYVVSVRAVLEWDPSVLQLIGHEDSCDDPPPQSPCIACTDNADCPSGVDCYCPGGPPCSGDSGSCATGRYEWSSSGFTEQDLDGLNDDFGDGDAYYLARANGGNRKAPVLPDQPLLVATFVFEALAPTTVGGTELILVGCAGSTPTCTLVSGDAWPADMLTGEIGTALIVVGYSPIPAVCEWGMAAMALLVLVAGTIVFRRRGLAPG